MKVVGISGSPRPLGNTEYLVKKAMEVCASQGHETEFYSLAKKNITMCTGCQRCTKPSTVCTHVDDAVPLLEAMIKADAIIVGSPTYFGSVSGQLKNLFDRTLPLRADGFKLAGKVGGAIAVGGSRNGGQEYVCSQIHNWMLIHEMTVVADRRTAHFGGIVVGRRLGEAANDQTGVVTVENLAMRISDLLNEKKNKK